MARAKKTETPTPPARKAKATSLKTTSVCGTWSELLIANEKAGRKSKKTDAQLVAEMQKIFPDKRDKSTILRIGMIRGCYNAGTNLMKSFGPAGTEARPISHAYDEAGNVLAKASRGRKSKAEGESPAPAPAKRRGKAEPEPTPAPTRRRSKPAESKPASDAPARRRRVSAK